MRLGPMTWPMAIGKAGAIAASKKREGDGKTPLGRYRLECLYYRPDRLVLPNVPLAHHAISARLGWCDDPSAKAYNQLVHKPFSASHEDLVRQDQLYDGLIVLSHNRWPAVPGYGSAIFLHIAKHDKGELKPTQGCLALRRSDFLAMLALLTPHMEISIV